MQRKVTSKLLLALVLLSVVISIIPVTQTLAAENEYADGAWSHITNLEIHINDVYIDGEPYSFSSKDIKVNSSSGYRDILVNDSATVRVGISVDEYGEINTYAEIL